MEVESDEFALRVVRDKNPFISAMKKLGELNLADMSPHPLIEFILYSHPSISKRIAFAQSYELQ